jgi:hypothetical protein
VRAKNSIVLQHGLSWVIALCITFFSAQAAMSAAMDNTGHLVDACRTAAKSRDVTDLKGKNWNELVNNAACLAYLTGFINGYMSGGGRGICLPTDREKISWGQIAAIYVQWGDRNAARWHLQPSMTVEMAFREAFPCR